MSEESKYDAEVIMPFVDGTLETLKVQCSFEAKPGKPYIKKPSDDFESTIAIIAVIGMMSDKFCGSIGLCFTEKVFLKVMGNMLMEEYSEINNELEDGAGELLNIIFGQAKNILSQKGYSIEKAIPSVIRGDDLKIHHFSKSPTVIIPFESSEGNFYIQIVKEVENK